MVSDDGFDDDRAGRIRAVQIAQLSALPYSFKAVAQLGVPRILLGAGPGRKLTADEIAQSIQGKYGKPVDAQNLDILLRLLAAYDVVKEEITTDPFSDAEHVERRYGATSVLKCLVDNEDGVSLVDYMRLHTDSVLQPTLQFLHEPVLDRTMEPHVLAHGKTLFDYGAADKRFDELFNRGMAGYTRMVVKLLLEHEHYRAFEGLSSLVDVGGGLGASLALILEKYPNLRGINFDQPHVVANGIRAPRLRHVDGDFFESIPHGDAVWMKWILHDWSDEHCLKILKNIEKALPRHGKIINMDAVLPEATDGSATTKVNLSTSVLMMAYSSRGRERTLTEFRKLAAQAGFPRVEIVATVDSLSILEFYKT